MCIYIYIYIHNKYTQHTHIYTYILCKQTFILDVINHLTALIYIYTIFCLSILFFVLIDLLISGILSTFDDNKMMCAVEG